MRAGLTLRTRIRSGVMNWPLPTGLDKLAGFVLAFGLVCASTSGCKPKAGSSCKIESKEVCIAGDRALACHDGKWEEMPCRGPGGCAKSGSGEACDQSVAEAKDVCNLAGDFVCASDKKSTLECQKSHWTPAQTCLGEHHCVVGQGKVVCDNSIANAGDSCPDENDSACSPDMKTALVCHGNVFVVARTCRGKNACRVTPEAAGFKVECDDAIANVGDPCDKEGRFTCASDEKAIVKCVGRKLQLDEKCLAHQKCSFNGSLVGCY